jgi:hypothetical protein
MDRRSATKGIGALFAIGASASARANISVRELAPLEVGGALIETRLEPDVFELEDAALRAWIRRSAEVVSRYYGRFPVPKIRLRLKATGGAGVRTGNMRGWGVPRLNVIIGESSSKADLRRDWVLVHEMVHTAFPDVADHQNWIEEGLAVYVESIARMQAGDLSAQHVWSEFLKRMPRGQPGPNDLGLDRTDTWGNRYWGGAIFSFVADLNIRRETQGQLTLASALRGLLAQELDNRTRMPLAEALKIADSATGTHVLSELYEQRKHRPVVTDLDAIWKGIGVIQSGNTVVFDDSAPQSWLRQAITAG